MRKGQLSGLCAVSWQCRVLSFVKTEMVGLINMYDNFTRMSTALFLTSALFIFSPSTLPHLQPFSTFLLRVYARFKDAVFHQVSAQIQIREFIVNSSMLYSIKYLSRFISCSLSNG